MDYDKTASTFGARFLAPSAARIGADYIAFDCFASMGRIVREGPILHRGSTLDINTQMAAELAKHKSATSSVLRRAGIATPIEIVLPNVNWKSPFPSIEQLKSLSPYEIVVKPDTGTKGRGVSKHTTVEGALHAARALGDEAILLQRRELGPELRLYILHDRVLGGYWRRKHSEGFGNLSTGEAPDLFLGSDVPDEVSRCSIRAASALGLTYAGIDLIVSKHGPVILEANASARYDAAAGHVGGEEWAGQIIDTLLNDVIAKRDTRREYPKAF